MFKIPNSQTEPDGTHPATIIGVILTAVIILGFILNSFLVVFITSCLMLVIAVIMLLILSFE